MSDDQLGLLARVMVLRDEVLDTALHGDDSPPGEEVFDAIGRVLDGQRLADDGELARTIEHLLAWGGREEGLLADAEQVFDRLVLAADRAFGHPGELTLVIDAGLEVLVAVAAEVAAAAVARATRDRSQRVREEMVLRQLEDALAQQEANMRRLRAELPRDDY